MFILHEPLLILQLQFFYHCMHVLRRLTFKSFRFILKYQAIKKMKVKDVYMLSFQFCSGSLFK